MVLYYIYISCRDQMGVLSVSIIGNTQHFSASCLEILRSLSSMVTGLHCRVPDTSPAPYPTSEPLPIMSNVVSSAHHLH